MVAPSDSCPEEIACRHCGTKIATRPRRLCHACYADRSVRDLYRPESKYAPNLAPEPTEEELDRMIAEQMAALPDWWKDEAEMQRRHEPYSVPIVAAGLAGRRRGRWARE